MSEELIHKYLDGQMTKEDTNAFESQMKDDPSLSQEVLLFREMRQYASHKNQTIEATSVIKDVGQSFNPAKRKNKTISINQWKILLPIAATILLLIGFFSKSLFESNSSSLNAIEYEISPLSFQERSQQSPILLFSTSEITFNDAKYDQAILELDELINNNQEVNKARLYKSIALLRTNKHKIARIELELLETVPLYDNASFYYRGLSYLETKEYDEAKNMFAQVKDTSSYFKRSQNRIKELSLLK